LIRILFIEDSQADLDLILRSLKKTGLEVLAQRVESISQLKISLSETWDIILTDFHLQGFSAVEVLATIKELGIKTPTIVVSGAVSDETAADLLRNGAADFVRKDNTSRLAPAILREISAQRELVGKEELFRSLANSIPQLAWMARADGHIFWYNERWYEYTGTTEKQMEGWGWQTVHSPEELPRALAEWKAAIAEGQPATLEFPLRNKDGNYRWFLTKVTPVKDHNGTTLRWLGTNTDIEEERQTREALRKSRDAAEAANESKSRFLANMSHEIRTPMTAVLGFSELLRNPDLAEFEKLDAIERIGQAGRALLRIIDDILDISKVEAGKLEIMKTPFSPLELVTDVLSLLRLQAEAKCIEVSAHFADAVPQLAFSDPSRLRQILVNLVGNAIKFTPRGKVIVDVQVHDESHIGFHVIDTGIGISELDQNKLFASFAQADESITRQFGGSGLGLLLSRRLAEQLGGNLCLIESAAGKGSHFVATIRATPFSNSDFAPFLEQKLVHSAPERLVTGTPLTGQVILIAEDVPDNQVLMRRYLEGAGARVDFASNGEEAVNKALSSNYALVLMDVQMPVLDGIRATQRLREENYARPILALTAHAMPEEIERSLRAGCNAHLIKPISKQQLIAAVAQHLEIELKSQKTV
jgi:PAS domain S-box-containing protein